MWKRLQQHFCSCRSQKGDYLFLAITVIVLAASSVIFFPQVRVREFSSASPSLAKTEVEKKILTVLEEMLKSQRTYLSVPVQDGKALRLLTESVAARNVVEIGTSTGYSGLWFCLALQATGGRLTTFEIDHRRA